MPFPRRQFITFTASGIAAGLWSTSSSSLALDPMPESRIKALAFDAFCIFDSRPITALAEQLFPGKGNALSDLWRNRQFEYTWLRSMIQHYTDFWQVTREALEFAGARLNLEFTPEKRDQLMHAYLQLETWPDVRPALESLKKAGFRLALLSNFTPEMLGTNIACVGLAGIFEAAISTDQAKTFKPDPRAYQLGIDILKLRTKEILFVAFGGWDAAGAESFGYPTFWLNRTDLPPERLGVPQVPMGKTMADLLTHLATLR
jgi:2-haloacid dehalogenase